MRSNRTIVLPVCPVCGEIGRYQKFCDNDIAHEGKRPEFEQVRFARLSDLEVEARNRGPVVMGFVQSFSTG